jgi:uncharacterized protein YndB with AHSA1/START domain
MAERTRGYAHRVNIEAPAAVVWRGLLEPAVLAQWYAPEARVDARAGGGYWVRLDRSTERAAHIDVFDPPRRLRLIYMPQQHWPSGDAVIIDDFLVVPEKDTTVVRVLGSGIPDRREWDEACTRLRTWWGRGLLRLKLAAEKLARLSNATEAANGRRTSH